MGSTAHYAREDRNLQYFTWYFLPVARDADPAAMRNKEETYGQGKDVVLLLGVRI